MLKYGLSQQSYQWSDTLLSSSVHTDIPIKEDIVAQTEPRILKKANRLHSLQSTHVWKWPVVKYKHIKIKPKICILFILCLTWTVNANSLKQNIIVIKEICSS